MYLIILYALLTGFGVFGVGNFIWTRLKEESKNFSFPSSLQTKFAENFFLDLGISWLIGYFCYEGMLQLLSLIHLFHPFIVTSFSSVLTVAGYRWIFKHKKSLALSLNACALKPWEIGTLFFLQAFLLFWNLYPSFDVDSVAFYFNTVQNLLLHGGREFSPFVDIRQSVPVGENYLFALGFAVLPHSTVFTQILHALSKMMLVFGVFGAARALGAGVFALIASAFIVSEEHILASGANAVVRINMLLTLSVFFIGFGLFTYARTQKREYFFLSVIAAAAVLTCKYLGVNYLFCFLIATIAWLFFHPDLRAGFQLSPQKQSFTILILALSAFFALMPYGYNWIFTGSPFFPASFGPLTSPYYDKVAGDLARDWHFHLSLPEAVKNFSVFMVWPGILSSKILFPLALAASFFAFLTKKKEEQIFDDAMVFFAMSVIIVILSETYMVFEMRYYRYGIGIYALGSTLLVSFLLHSLSANSPFKKRAKGLSVLCVLLISVYCVRYSFDVMSFNRPRAKEILAFLTMQKSEQQIIAARYPLADKIYPQIKKINPNPKHTGLVLSFDWPQTFYPVSGKNIAFINAGGLKSLFYFNEGLFAQALLDHDITFVFNELAVDENYPLPGGACFHVFKQCGQTILAEKYSLLTLSRPCLEKLATHRDEHDAQERIDKALAAVKALPKYEPFNPPSYGGSSNVIK